MSLVAPPARGRRGMRGGETSMNSLQHLPRGDEVAARIKLCANLNDMGANRRIVMIFI